VVYVHAIIGYGLSGLRGILETGLLALLIYYVLLFMRGTRAMPMLVGISVVYIGLAVLSRLLGLEVIDWLLAKLWTLLAVFVLVIFQPEIRRALAEIGSQQGLMARKGRGVREMIDTVLDSTFYLAERRLGALIVLERKIGLRTLAGTGTVLNAPLTLELLTTVFFPNTPLHDGGVIVRDNRILAAGCILPLTQDPDLAKSLGTRHRAGVGVTEESDAVVVIVSEETGAVSLAYKGRLIRGVNRMRLERHLTYFMLRNGPWDRLDRPGWTARMWERFTGWFTERGPIENDNEDDLPPM